MKRLSVVAAATVSMTLAAQAEFCAVDNLGNIGSCFRTMSECQNTRITGLTQIGPHSCMLRNSGSSTPQRRSNVFDGAAAANSIFEAAEAGRRAREQREAHEQRMAQARATEAPAASVQSAAAEARAQERHELEMAILRAELQAKLKDLPPYEGDEWSCQAIGENTTRRLKYFLRTSPNPDTPNQPKPEMQWSVDGLIWEDVPNTFIERTFLTGTFDDDPTSEMRIRLDFAEQKTLVEHYSRNFFHTYSGRCEVKQKDNRNE